ncbi:hypothetical protein [Nocardiopsis coralliicola]
MFTMTLVPPSTPPGPGDPEVINPLDEYIPVVMEACERMRDTDFQFRVSGFGLRWPVDSTDLSLCMEDLPEALEDLRAGRTGTIWFCEQGTQRQLHLHDEGDRVRIRCVPDEHGTGETPDPADEYLPRADFDRMVRDLTTAFAHCVLLAVPEAAGLAPFPDWRAGRV